MTANWFARILVLAAMSLLAACAQPGGASPSPSAASSPTRDATASPVVTATESGAPEATTGATPAPVGLAVDSIAEVIATDPMVIRSEPRIAADSEIYEEQLTTGDRLFVTMGPIFESGYEWYQVQPIQRPPFMAEDELLFGFVAAASREGEPWLAAVTLSCPDPPTIDDLIGLEPTERLHCYGDDELTFAGESSGCGIQDPATLDPGWFENPICLFGPSASLSVRIAPEATYPGPGSGTFQVTGHFDDPRARDCVWINDNPDIPEPPADAVVLRCRMEFVATEIVPAP